jgi:hypothetical protein
MWPVRSISIETCGLLLPTTRSGSISELAALAKLLLG